MSAVVQSTSNWFCAYHGKHQAGEDDEADPSLEVGRDDTEKGDENEDGAVDGDKEGKSEEPIVEKIQSWHVIAQVEI